MNAGLLALKRLKNILPQSQLCSVYYALVESHLHYGDVVWGSLCKTKLTALQGLQSRAWSIIENAKIKDHWSSSWLNVENIIRYDRNVMTYKIVNRLCRGITQEILKIFKSLDQEQSFSKRVFTMHL